MMRVLYAKGKYYNLIHVWKWTIERTGHGTRVLLEYPDYVETITYSDHTVGREAHDTAFHRLEASFANWWEDISISFDADIWYQYINEEADHGQEEG